MDCVICRYGEIALKGKNRGIFEKRLVTNIQDCLKKNRIVGSIRKLRGRIYIFTKDVNVIACLRCVFGLVSISPAISVEADTDTIKSTVKEYVLCLSKEKKLSTFRITTKRINKEFKTSSGEFDSQIGKFVADNFGLKVNLKNHNLDLNIEIYEKAFIFHDKVDCFGGLPLGMTGNVAAIIEDKKGLAAAWLCMRRGCMVFPLVRNETDITSLERYSYGTKIIAGKAGSTEEINRAIQDHRCKAIITGDFLEDFNPDKYKEFKVPVLTPLIGYNKAELDVLLKRIL